MSELDELERHLEHAADEVLDEIRKVVGRGAFNIKKDWQRRWTGHAFLPHLPRAVSYDLERRGHTISAEIGPDKRKKQGPLGNIIEFGSINNAPIPGGLPALDAERPRFIKAIADVGEKLLQ